MGRIVGNLSEYGALAVGGTGLIALVGMMIKFIIVDGFKGRSAITTIRAGDNLIDRLQGEILRLEEIISKQSRRIDVLESRMQVIHDLEVQDAADISELTILLETSCPHCPHTRVTQTRMAPILGRMRERRNTEPRTTAPEGAAGEST